MGVIQSSGRTFGDVDRSLLATERLVLITAKTHPDAWGHAMQVCTYVWK